jgi:hypothetical protein
MSAEATMDLAELVTLYPQLHHMAEAGSWASIQRIGLRTTEQLVNECNPDSTTRLEILGQQRKRSYELLHPAVGALTIRDQAPLGLHNLRPALTDMTVEEWLEALNNRVFFWAHPQRLERLLNARLYRDSIHDVLVVDTARLVEAHRDRIRLAGMNTGSTIFPGAPKRGRDTFRTIETFPFQDRRRAGRGVVNNVVEVCVLDGLHDVKDFVVRVERRKGATVVETLYEA